MSLASRGTRAAARTLRQTPVPRQPRRNASSGGHGHEHDHPPSHGESALHLPDANPKGNESMGVRQVWGVLRARSREYKINL